jgi:hypothetical protein
MLRISNFNASWQLAHLLGSKDGSVVDYGIIDVNDITDNEIKVKFLCKEKEDHENEGEDVDEEDEDNEDDD